MLPDKCISCRNKNKFESNKYPCNDCKKFLAVGHYYSPTIRQLLVNKLKYK